jgi:DNA-binding NarL/FixJ family response regulator
VRRRTRILLVEMPRILCDILADVLSAEPDMEVVGVLSHRGKLRATVAETRADVVVLALGDSRLPEDCGRLLRAHPRIRVLGVTSEGRRGFLFGLRPLKASLGELSPQGLVKTIRTTDRREAKRLSHS